MSMTRLLNVALAGIVGASLTVATLSAQDTSGTISGTVTDDQGQVVPGATATAIN